jgi:hypothetical protein
VYSFGLVLTKAHITSLPKLRVQLQLLEVQQRLLQARRKVDAVATGEQGQEADNSAAAAAAKLGDMSIDDFVAMLKSEVATRKLRRKF